MQGSPRIDELRQKFHENPRRYFAPLANEYRKAGDPEQAIAICRAHLAQQPGHMSGHVVYGQALYDADRPVEARAVFEKALALDPDNAIVLRQLGDIARERGDSQEARHWYGKALDIDPQDKEVAAYVAELSDPVTIPEEPKAAPREADDAVAVEPVEAAGAADVAGTAELAEGAAAGDTQEAAESVAPEDDEEDVAWRKTPQPEASPFVTRTMAELYARQGYHAAALDVYRQLAINHPDDLEIRARIEELSKPSEPAPAPSEPARISPPEPEPGDAATTEVAEPLGLVDLTGEPAFQLSTERLESTGEHPTPDAGGKHFTEVDLSAGDSWDTDAWAAGFTPDDEVGSEFEAADSHPASSAEAAGGDTETAHEAEQVAAADGVAAEAFESEGAPAAPEAVAAPEARPPEAIAEPEALAEPEVLPEAAAAIEPEPVAAAEPEAQSDSTTESAAAPEPEAPETEATAEAFAWAEPERVAEREPEPVATPDVIPYMPVATAYPEDAAAEEEEQETPGVVAYSPEPPPDEELAHFTPRQPTVREFFATLGARRPPGPEAAPSFTARAALPGEDLPLATDAFAGLFGDSDVNEEDTRAAFALTGAISGKAHSPVHPRVQTSPPRPSPAIPDETPGQAESEEDIRRFREWLDGLAQS